VWNEDKGVPHYKGLRHGKSNPGCPILEEFTTHPTAHPAAGCISYAPGIVVDCVRLEEEIRDQYHIVFSWICRICLQCFDAVGWAAGRASSM